MKTYDAWITGPAEGGLWQSIIGLGNGFYITSAWVQGSEAASKAAEKMAGELGIGLRWLRRVA